MDDSSKTQSSLFPMETCQVQVSDEAFNLFHAIDRELYARLIHGLGRDPTESVQVMAFWMWLERESKDMNFIKRVLSLPLPLLNDAVDETLVCLRCVENDAFLFAGDGISGGDILTLLPEILSCNNNRNIVSLRLFHENRVAVVRAVVRIINTVCARAFGDILRRSLRAAVAADGGGAAPAPVLYQSHLNVPFVPLPATGALMGMAAPSVLPAAVDVVGVPIQWMAGAFPTYAQRQMVSKELGELVSRKLSINSNRSESVNGDGEMEVPADDRTIFLTFSKGYPITQDEVREFFTRRFGDFIEDMIMQDVGDDEQVLYARMVARSAGVIEGIVGGNKAKYIINGKHVWARKYVKKQHQFPPPRTARWAGGDDNNHSSSSSSSSSPSSSSIAYAGEQYS